MGSLKNVALVGGLVVLVGVLASKLKAGLGLQELGAGLYEIGVAPFKGLGMGLGYTAGGVTAMGEAVGGVGRGLSEFFKPFIDLFGAIGGGYGGGEGFGTNGGGNRVEDRYNGVPKAETWLMATKPTPAMGAMYGWRAEDRNGTQYRVWLL